MAGADAVWVELGVVDGADVVWIGLGVGDEADGFMFSGGRA